MSDRRIDQARSQIEFSEEVPEDVVTRFEDVKDILEAARENKRMLRAAIEYTMTTTELALRLLCDRLGFEDPMEKDSVHTLNNLLEWLHSRDYLPHRGIEEPEDRPRKPDEELDRDLPGMYQALRDLRNTWLHTRDASWLGWGFLRMIPHQADFINRLFDAPRRRREERKKRREVNHHCRRLKEEGVALKHQEKRFLLYEINMLYCDASEVEDAYYFAMWPLFDRGREQISSSEYAPYLAKCTSVCLTDRWSLELKTRRGTSLLLDHDLRSDEKRKLKRWRSNPGGLRSIALDLAGPATLRALLLGLGRHFPVSINDLNWID